MVLSENGWPALASAEGLPRFEAGGGRFIAANDDVAVVLGEFIDQFTVKVEPIVGPVLDDWSYANRLVRGSTSVVSNHGSATAVDLNALEHPRGVHNTFSTRERDIMHAIRDSISDDRGRTVLRLGIDYRSTVDDMHVEIAPGADKARVKQAADKIRARKRAEKEAREMAELKINLDSDQWADHEWTDSDVAAIGDPKLKGKTGAWSSILRFPPAVARLRRELAEAVRAIRGDITSARADVAAVKVGLAELRGAVEAQGAATSAALAEIDRKLSELNAEPGA